MVYRGGPPLFQLKGIAPMSKNIEEKIELILKEIDHSIEYRDNLHLREDLNLDSLDVIKLLFEVELQMNIEIPEEDIDQYELMKLGNLCRYIENKAAP